MDKVSLFYLLISEQILAIVLQGPITLHKIVLSIHQNQFFSHIPEQLVMYHQQSSIAIPDRETGSDLKGGEGNDHKFLVTGKE